MEKSVAAIQCPPIISTLKYSVSNVVFSLIPYPANFLVKIGDRRCRSAPFEVMEVHPISIFIECEHNSSQSPNRKLLHFEDGNNEMKSTQACTGSSNAALESPRAEEGGHIGCHVGWRERQGLGMHHRAMMWPTLAFLPSLRSRSLSLSVRTNIVPGRRWNNGDRVHKQAGLGEEEGERREQKRRKGRRVSTTDGGGRGIDAKTSTSTSRSREY